MWPVQECWPQEGRERGGIPRCLPSAWNLVGPSEQLHRHLLYLLAWLLREERTCGRNGSSRRPVVRGPDSVPSRRGRSSSLYPTRLPGGAGTGPESHTPVLAPHMHVGIHLRSRPPWPPPHPPPADVAVVSRPQRCRLETECPVFCGCRGRWGWGTGSPANKHTQRPLVPPCLCTHARACTHA